MMKRWLLIGLSVLIFLWLVTNVCTTYFLGHMIFRPEKLPADYTFNIDHPFEEISIDRPDGKVHGLFFPKEKAVGVVLFFHGNRRTVNRWAGIADQFLSRGFAVFIPDYRGYGKSVGKLNEEIFYADALACYQWLNQNWRESEIILIGRSLGSAAASFTAANTHCRALVLETPFYSIPDLFYAHVPFLPRAFSFRYQFSNADHLNKVLCPVMIVAGGKDQVVPLRTALKLKTHLKEKDEMLVIEEAGHHNLSSFTEYRQFLDRALEVNGQQRLP